MTKSAESRAALCSRARLRRHVKTEGGCIPAAAARSVRASSPGVSSSCAADRRLANPAGGELQRRDDEQGRGPLNSPRWLQVSRSDYLDIHHREVTGVWVVCSHF